MENLNTNMIRLGGLFPMGCRHKKTITALMVFGATCLLAVSRAHAFNPPAAGTFAFDIYDIGVNQILKGPIGFAAGVGSMVAASVMAIRQMLLPAAATVLGGPFS